MYVPTLYVYGGVTSGCPADRLVLEVTQPASNYCFSRDNLRNIMELVIAATQELPNQNLNILYMFQHVCRGV